jgi:hypothetical protein
MPLIPRQPPVLNGRRSFPNREDFGGSNVRSTLSHIAVAQPCVLVALGFRPLVDAAARGLKGDREAGELFGERGGVGCRGAGGWAGGEFLFDRAIGWQLRLGGKRANPIAGHLGRVDLPRFCSIGASSPTKSCTSVNWR